MLVDERFSHAVPVAAGRVGRDRRQEHGLRDPDVVAPASVAWTLAFDNQDNLPHNVVIQDASGQTVFASEVFTGPALRTQAAPALAPGSYTFTCAIHSDMKGTLTAG